MTIMKPPWTQQSLATVGKSFMKACDRRVALHMNIMHAQLFHMHVRETELHITTSVNGIILTPITQGTIHALVLPMESNF